MWEELEAHPEKSKLDVLHELFNIEEFDLTGDCFACEARVKVCQTSGRKYVEDCTKCPLDWGDFKRCEFKDSLWVEWSNAKSLIVKSALAGLIARLPLRKVEPQRMFILGADIPGGVMSHVGSMPSLSAFYVMGDRVDYESYINKTFELVEVTRETHFR